MGYDGIVTHDSKIVIDQVYIVTEYVEGPLLYDFLTECGPIGEELGRYFLFQLLEILEHLSAHNVTHRDIKLENMLLDGDMNLKLVDFGFSEMGNIDRLESFKGT